MAYYKPNSLTKAVSCWYNPRTEAIANEKKNSDFIYFASQHELSVYRHLSMLIKFSGKSITIEHQKVVTIKPPSRQMGLLSWKIDFVLRDTMTNKVEAYVEAKGGWIRSNSLFESEFYQKLHMWDSFYPDTFELLYVVGDQGLCRVTNAPIKIYSLVELTQSLMEVWKV